MGLGFLFFVEVTYPIGLVVTSVELVVTAVALIVASVKPQSIRLNMPWQAQLVVLDSRRHMIAHDFWRPCTFHMTYT